MEEGSNNKRDSIFSASKGDERRTLNKIEIVSIRILERWDEAINTFQIWREHKASDSSRADIYEHKIRAVLYAIYIMNKEMFERRLENKPFEDLSKTALSVKSSSDDLEICFSNMNKAFDDLGIVRVDLARQNHTLEELNKKKGFD
jgi:hypothetical protein